MKLLDRIASGGSENGFGMAGNHDTIGMVAIDGNGKVAAGTSTNGASHKIPGLDGWGVHYFVIYTGFLVFILNSENNFAEGLEIPQFLAQELSPTPMLVGLQQQGTGML